SAAAGVEQKRCRAHCGIGIRVVEDQRSSTNTRVVAVYCVAGERIPANCRVSSASGEVLKCVATFRCREPGITPVRCRTDCLHFWQKPQEKEREYDDKGFNSGFHSVESLSKTSPPCREQNLSDLCVSAQVERVVLNALTRECGFAA